MPFADNYCHYLPTFRQVKKNFQTAGSVPQDSAVTVGNRPFSRRNSGAICPVVEEER